MHDLTGNGSLDTLASFPQRISSGFSGSVNRAQAVGVCRESNEDLSGQAITKETFERVVLECLDLLNGYARKLTRDRGAEDLVQETVLKALRARGQYRAGTNFKAWIFKIMTNLYIDQYRKKERAPGEVAIDNVFSLKADEASESFGDVDQVTELESLERLLPDQLLRALDTLPEAHRTAVLLRELGDFSYKEIATILDCPIGTVMSRLHYARNELKKQLTSHAKTEGFLPDSEE